MAAISFSYAWGHEKGAPVGAPCVVFYAVNMRTATARIAITIANPC